ncbi:hypothetical protein Tsubulata_041617 [Turnera subulata]|uniref:DUF4408 domain-containing protein n=1 Tax=Turnera subulata TaxID=218843 RepID=A0A9Q0JF36_9ROSI|nr:hypothetical protein Tsubulata_041617 [Turnera subulata]
MDPAELQDLQKLNQFTNSHTLKKITQLLLSVSLISFFLSNLSWLSLIQYLNIYSTFPVKLFSHTLDKNCIFLLCNGLLVFVAKYSGLFSSTSSSKYSLNSYKSFNDYEEGSIPPLAPELPVVDKELILVESEVQRRSSSLEEEKENEQVMEAVEEKEAEELINVQDEVEEDGDSTAEQGEDDQIEVQELYNVFLIQEEEEEDDIDEVEEGNGLLSTEELNKKFDEFIRKMREEIRIESQQQLVMVN